MQQWEYKALSQSVRASFKLLEGTKYAFSPDFDLVQMGKEGWELTSTMPLNFDGNTTEVIYYFKRLMASS